MKQQRESKTDQAGKREAPREKGRGAKSRNCYKRSVMQNWRTGDSEHELKQFNSGELKVKLLL